MYNDQLVYKVVIWAFFGISLWKENVTLKSWQSSRSSVFYNPENVMTVVRS